MSFLSLSGSNLWINGTPYRNWESNSTEKQPLGDEWVLNDLSTNPIEPFSFFPSEHAVETSSSDEIRSDAQASLSSQAPALDDTSTAGSSSSTSSSEDSEPRPRKRKRESVSSSIEFYSTKLTAKEAEEWQAIQSLKENSPASTEAAEREKVLRKRVKNRKAAKAARDRKKQHLQDLEGGLYQGIQVYKRLWSVLSPGQPEPLIHDRSTLIEQHRLWMQAIDQARQVYYQQNLSR